MARYPSYRRRSYREEESERRSREIASKLLSVCLPGVDPVKDPRWAFKVRDRATGLYWAGTTTNPLTAMGKRWDTPKALENDLGKYLRPKFDKVGREVLFGKIEACKNWEIVSVRIIEEVSDCYALDLTLRNTQVAAELACIGKPFATVFSEANEAGYADKIEVMIQLKPKSVVKEVDDMLKAVAPPGSWKRLRNTVCVFDRKVALIIKLTINSRETADLGKIRQKVDQR